MPSLSGSQLLRFMPAMAVAALDARVHEMVQDGYWSPGPATPGGRTIAQSRDIRRANVLLQDCKSDLYYATHAYFRTCRQGGVATLPRMNEAAERERQAEALYHAAWNGWYGN